MSRTFIILTLLLSFQTGAQDIISYRGARSAALASAFTNLKDGYSIFNNIGGIAHVEKWTAAGGYQHRYALSAFQSIAAGLVIPHRQYALGFGVVRFGDEIFNQNHLRAAIGNKIQNISLGLSVDYHQYSIQTIGVARAFTFSFGGIAEIIPKLAIGLHATNLTQSRLNTEPESPIPTILTAGLSYQPTSELIMLLEIEKELDFQELLKAGIEYRVIEHVFLRTGVQPARQTASFGLGFAPKRWQLDYAFITDPGIGNMHDFSFLYQLRP